MTTEHMFRGEQNLPENKILSYEQAVAVIKQSRERGLRVIMAQGVFDIVHIGHVEYFRQAKQAGDLLIVGIENDDSVRLNKGENRPFNNVGDRLKFLSELQAIDFCFSFEDSPNYSEDPEIFIDRYRKLSPNAIAVSGWDPNIELKKMQATEASIEIAVIDYRANRSTTRLMQSLGYE